MEAAADAGRRINTRTATRVSPMSSIQQTYATHCTYASSAIERRETGDVRDRVLGYSARASSYSQADLRRHFRTIERFLYYYLPKDTPPDKKQSLTPQAAPHRLFFCPAVSGLQALGHITYRQTDCAGRVGSYFGHVLTADANGTGGPWDVIECLQLWNAPGWVLEDSPAFSYDLPPLPALSSLRSGSDRPLDERVLWSFLNTPPGGSFHAPDAKLIPDRWRQMPVADRQRFFRLALTGYLEAASQPRESLLLLAEPPIAVLFFYGIARLLPAELRTALSFSTFEATADRLITALAALTFDDERAGGDVPDERYKRGFVVNTWRADRASPLRYTQGRYADLLLSPLVGRADTDAANLAESIDHILARFQAVGVTQAAELEPLARAHAAVRQIFEPGAGPPPDDSWQKSPPQRAYVMKAVRQQLRGTPNAALLDRLLKSPEHLPLIFEFALSAAGEDDCAESLTYLVERVEPLEQLDQLLGGGEEARRYKLHALRHYVATHRRLPHPCRWLWTPPSVQHGSPRPPLLFELLHSPETTAQVLRDSLGGVPDEALNLLFRDVLTGGLDASDRRDILTRLAGRPAFNIQSLVGELVAKLAAHADVLRPVLVPHLCKLLEQLPDQPSRFAETMALLEIAQPLWTGAAAAAGIHGWLDLKKKVDGYQQQAGAQSSVLGRGAKGFGPWEFEQQAGTLLIPWVSSLGPPQSARDRSQKIAALLCGLAKDSGIGHCLSQESEPYLAAVLRKDEAEQKRIREAVAAAQAEKEERTTQRLSSVTKLLATTLIVLLAVLLGIFLWREIGARHGPATGLNRRHYQDVNRRPGRQRLSQLILCRSPERQVRRCRSRHVMPRRTARRRLLRLRPHQHLAPLRRDRL